ncbi:MAG: glycosyltransferase family 2 protein [Gammaproteobacteria bacterium]
MPDMNTLSVIIITRNEAADIRYCLESVKWANEIIVLDSGSSDQTVAICREYTAKVFSTDWPGYGIQKNRALQYATSEWVLSLDADERVSDDLRHQIQTAITQNTSDAYAIPFQSRFCGQVIKWGAWRSEKHVRLFKRSQGKFSDAIVHEKLLINGQIGQLTAPILHDSYKNFEEVLEKMNCYSTYGAELRLQQGNRGGLTIALLHGIWAFIKSYCLQLGFLDGKMGFILAISIAEGSYYRYLKLMLLAKQKPQREQI